MTNTNKKYERTQQGNLHSPIPDTGVSNGMTALLQIPAVTAKGSPRCAQAGGGGEWGSQQAPPTQRRSMLRQTPDRSALSAASAHNISI